MTSTDENATLDFDEFYEKLKARKVTGTWHVREHANGDKWLLNYKPKVVDDDVVKITKIRMDDPADRMNSENTIDPSLYTIWLNPSPPSYFCDTSTRNEFPPTRKGYRHDATWDPHQTIERFWSCFSLILVSCV